MKFKVGDKAKCKCWSGCDEIVTIVEVALGEPDPEVKRDNRHSLYRVTPIDRHHHSYNISGEFLEPHLSFVGPLL